MTDFSKYAASLYTDYLSKHEWDWFATLKLNSRHYNRRRALQRFDNWLDELEDRDGDSHFRSLRVIKHDAKWHKVCFYVVVGGLRNRRSHYESRWEYFGGKAEITRFDPFLPGIKSMLKTIARHPDPEIDQEPEGLKRCTPSGSKTFSE